MGIGEAFVKLLFRSRVRLMQRIGEASELIGEGRAEETLDILAGMERRIPPYVGHLFFLTKGRALDDLRRYGEAELAYTAAAVAKEGASAAHLHAAVLCGRLCRFDDARVWISRLREDDEADEQLLEQASDLESMIDDVVGGKKLEEVQERVREFAVARGLEELGRDEALAKLDGWVESDGEAARDARDELALWIGELLAGREGHGWELSLALEDSRVVGGEEEHIPFELAASRLDDGRKLSEILDG